ncbi:putative DsbA family dithiol-disulfide isomerase [Flavobacterium nitrogenifigens]|uniref:DsbA family dithiol-disulfide isomerase n=2 Tax=Flavobacterium TaxID=237 RepID=A0ABR6QDB5_9FLAO|nr:MULTISPECIES: DsbA family protein [Flavobacterium]MBB4802267.1 putative DsbA family dithiol-disulfide isomerase [Flavobacterium nitrogenifigens]MBB6387225.1 putative DsbA family dithiol-disulfide isomerase [Flavobacterium notoginsengisoli]
MSEEKTNPLLCDPVNGTCEMPLGEKSNETATISTENKPIKIVYYTDPICSSCWGIEPQLRKLKLEYGDYFEIDYRMGGLLPDWSYNSGGISKPSDVAHHWDEASLYYEMPIDGDVWLEDPLDSSYPSCIAMKAAQIQSKEKAVKFMRILREKLYLEKKNVAKWENISEVAKLANLDLEKLKKDYDGDAKKLFEDDLKLGKTLGVRGFPTLFFADGNNNQLTVYGSKPYSSYKNALLALHPEARKEKFVSKNTLSIFEVYPTLAPKEYAIILDISVKDATIILEELYSKGKLNKKNIKNGSLYSVK